MKFEVSNFKFQICGAVIARVRNLVRIRGIVDSPETRGIVNNPRIRGIVNNPRTRVIVDNPRTRSIVNNPRIRGIVNNPETRGIVNNPRTRVILSPKGEGSALLRSVARKLRVSETLKRILRSGMAAPNCIEPNKPGATIALLEPGVSGADPSPAAQDDTGKTVYAGGYGNWGRAKLQSHLARFTAAVLVSVLLAGSLPAQQSQPSPPPASKGQYTLRVESQLVLVNVVARDKSGKPVTDLKREDFTILEDGKPQKISSFDFENLDSTPLSAGATGPAQQTVEGKPLAPSKPLLTRKDAEEALSNKRVIVLFFDLGSMDPDQTQRAVDAARKYVQTKMTAADMIAIVSLASSLRLDLDFTNDQSRLLRVLNRFTHAEGQGMDSGPTGDADGIEETGNAYTPDETEYNQFNTDRKLQALQSIAQVLSRFNQKKSVIYFSSGMTQTGIENQAALRAAINTAIKANVAIYTLDARGLEAEPPGGSAATASLRGAAMYSGAAVQNALDSNFASQETLTTLAGDTGGKAFLDTNDLGQVFDRVQRDTSVYYVLGYSSNNPLRDGRYRHIQVKVNRAGLNLEFRKGYYAPKDFEHFNAEDKEQQMEDELASELPNTDVAVYMAASYFRLDDRRFYVPVALVVPGSQIPFTQGGDKDKASLDIIGQVLDELKRPVGSVRETVKLSLDASQQVRRKNVQYSTGFLLTPGKYHFKFVVRENQSGRLGSFETDFSIPDIKKAPLKMSSVVLASQRQPNNKKTQNPLVRDGNELVPNIAHVFSLDQHLYFFYEVYDPSHDKSPAPSPDSKEKVRTAEIKNPIHLLTSIAFFNGKIPTYETPLVEARQLNAPERKAAVFQFDIPLNQLKPGLYTCQVKVIDDAGGTFSFPRLPILVRDKPAVPAITSGAGQFQ